MMERRRSISSLSLSSGTSRLQFGRAKKGDEILEVGCCAGNCQKLQEQRESENGVLSTVDEITISLIDPASPKDRHCKRGRRALNCVGIECEDSRGRAVREAQPR
jgi:hypothetical protein